MLLLRRPLTLHKAFQVKGGSDVPIGQIKQSKNQSGQIYPAITMATAILLSRGPPTSWTGFTEASEKARGMKARC